MLCLVWKMTLSTSRSFFFVSVLCIVLQTAAMTETDLFGRDIFQC